MARVNLLKTPAGIMLGGPMFGGNETDLGAMMANELMLTLIIAASILSILTVIRHTRAEEESGAAELVLSSVVGRYARTAAALILVGGVNTTLAVTMTVAMAATGLRRRRHRRDVLRRHRRRDGVRRRRSGHRPALAAGAHGVRARRWLRWRSRPLFRGVGDVIDNSGSALSWISPIAWAQQMRAVRRSAVVAVGLADALLIVALIAVAVALESRRQYDDGVLPRPPASSRMRARSRACSACTSPWNAGQTIGWTVGSAARPARHSGR